MDHMVMCLNGVGATALFFPLSHISESITTTATTITIVNLSATTTITTTSSSRASSSQPWRPQTALHQSPLDNDEQGPGTLSINKPSLISKESQSLIKMRSWKSLTLKVEKSCRDWILVTSATVSILLLFWKSIHYVHSDGTPAMQINRIVSHPTMSILVTAHKDKYIRIFDITTGLPFFLNS